MSARLSVIMVALLLGMNVAMGSTLTFEADSAKNRPVSKVINLLKDMLKQLEKEAEEDEEIYDKMACWCETNDKEKTKSIADAEERINELTTKTEELSAKTAALGTEIEHLTAELAKDQKALAEATANRKKQLAEFNEEEKDMFGAIQALTQAVTVLGKHHGGASLLQTAHVATTLQRAMEKHAPLLKEKLTHKERRVITAFIQSPQDYFDAEPTFKQSYAPQSGAIFGILQQMKETFEANLADTQKEEASNQAAFEDLKAAKEEQIAAGQEAIDTKTVEKAKADEFLAHSKQDIEDTKASLTADEAFLVELKQKCSMTDKQWDERQKTRQLEMEACSKALEVLSGDDAHDLFTKTFNPALVQTESAMNSERRVQASKLLATVASKVHSPRLSTLAFKVKLDAFERVKKAMDDMIAELIKEKEEEIKHNDFCTKEFNENKAQTVKKDRKKEDLIGRIAELDKEIDDLTKAIDDLKSEIAEMQAQLKKAGEDREKQNKEFQLTVADQRATQKLLKAALTVLEDFYKSALLQKAKRGDPAPAGFEEYKKNAASGGVMGMIEQIIQDAKTMEAEAVRGEEEGQKAYEDFVKETNASVEEKSKDIVNKREDKATAEEALVTAKEEKEAVLLELEQLANYNAELHQSCDFVMKNFNLRQEARDQEVEALRQAKAILSGANFEAFLQARPLNRW